MNSDLRRRLAWLGGPVAAQDLYADGSSMTAAVCRDRAGWVRLGSDPNLTRCLVDVEGSGRHLRLVCDGRSLAADARLDRVLAHVGRRRDPLVRVLRAVILDHRPGRAILPPELVLERRRSARPARRPRDGAAGDR